LEHRRRQAVLAVEQGESVEDVARIHGATPRSVYRWLQRATTKNGLAAKPHPGPKRRLTPEQERQLERMLATGAQAFGWPNQLWTTQRIADVIFRKFGVRLHHDHVGRFLRQRLKWSPQKPRRRARERKEGAIRYWRSRRFPAIVAEARQRGAHLVFLDESGFMLTPTVRKTWAPTGRTPLLSCWDRRDRLSVISGITVSPERGQLNFYFQVLKPNKNAKAEDTIAFLRHLRRQLGGPMTVIWDRSNIHKRSKIVSAYLEKHPEIVEESLPGYAPELNPDEGVWGWTKYGRLANLAAANVKELQTRMEAEFATLRTNRHLLRSFIEEANLALSA
jgi:transposase